MIHVVSGAVLLINTVSYGNPSLQGSYSTLQAAGRLLTVQWFLESCWKHLKDFSLHPPLSSGWLAIMLTEHEVCARPATVLWHRGWTSGASSPALTCQTNQVGKQQMAKGPLGQFVMLSVTPLQNWAHMCLLGPGRNAGLDHDWQKSRSISPDASYLPGVHPAETAAV